MALTVELTGTYEEASVFNDLYGSIRPPIGKVRPITCIEQVIGVAARLNDGSRLS